MSDWRSVEEIMRDLSVAQGYMVPATLKTFSGNGPPAYEVEEDSIEQSFYTSEGPPPPGDLPPPSYKLIQQMLNMVKEVDQDGTVADANDLDLVETHHTREKPKEMAKKAGRPMPPEVIPSMFKKKSSNRSEQSHNLRSQNLPSVQISPSPDKSKQFTPSEHASAYYSKFVEKSQLKERFEEDLWSRVERQMKEAEEKQKLKAELVSSKERGNVSSADASAVFAAFDLALPEHRHVLPGDCVVCIVAAKHGFYF
ncbi:hypothetical protein PYW08_016813 [Mythimna loreyi]|uniref:Uncharacterized protein n=1 Tax=Mythimna loreyi TaxID=667449 RepID=A0ACC2QY20_9NEOP|nr:hypothetical protein PYW08_016813 [Mythimna loreyi]